MACLVVELGVYLEVLKSKFWFGFYILLNLNSFRPCCSPFSRGLNNTVKVTDQSQSLYQKRIHQTWICQTIKQTIEN